MRKYKNIFCGMALASVLAAALPVGYFASPHVEEVKGPTGCFEKRSAFSKKIRGSLGIKDYASVNGRRYSLDDGQVERAAYGFFFETHRLKATATKLGEGETEYVRTYIGADGSKLDVEVNFYFSRGKYIRFQILGGSKHGFYGNSWSVDRNGKFPKMDDQEDQFYFTSNFPQIGRGANVELDFEALANTVKEEALALTGAENDTRFR